MGNITVEDLIKMLREYNPDAIPMFKKACTYAALLHHGQFRKSGEPYIIHPLNVAYILEEMHMDEATVCAGILHDIIEDTSVTKKDIKNVFNSEVASLVDGVTKMGAMDFSSKSEQNLANMRKQILGITSDVRIIIIKLADRLHNMRTLQFMKREKQIEIALETLQVYVPLAYHIGAYHIKKELEDLSLKYIQPDDYNRIEHLQSQIQVQTASCLNEMRHQISEILNDNNIPNDIKIRMKNIYGIYQRIEQGHKLSDIHDLLYLKVIVETVGECYQSLGFVHSKYHPINNKFKDYICNPKTNMYRSIHTTVFGEGGRLVQAQIRTKGMDRIASIGIAAAWDSLKGEAKEKTQQDLQNYQFYQSLKEIDSDYKDDKKFFIHVKRELFDENIYVFTPKGDIIELPIGSTPIDFAYKIHSDVGDYMIAAYVNDEPVKFNYILKNQDRVKIVTNDKSLGPTEEWIESAKTSGAKRKIKERIKRNTYN